MRLTRTLYPSWRELLAEVRRFREESTSRSTGTVGVTFHIRLHRAQAACGVAENASRSVFNVASQGKAAVTARALRTPIANSRGRDRSRGRSLHIGRYGLQFAFRLACRCAHSIPSACAPSVRRAFDAVRDASDGNGSPLATLPAARRVSLGHSPEIAENSALSTQVPPHRIRQHRTISPGSDALPHRAHDSS